MWLENAFVKKEPVGYIGLQVWWILVGRNLVIINTISAASFGTVLRVET